ncbi:response regulator transcription factor [Macrococcus equipercicus]|uniref:Response regulator transcription factor n=1 Tax=Macrococcus equipercicus TaxID=69967 RepID=A0A9Q9BY36_9STAP|nr:response regulator transcription factor [Macrococcus equipercicus]UTH14782.1 response regulator transcription factor [Macrococcus equipercicus]
MKILIIEDDSVIARSLAAELDRWQYDTYTVENFNNIMSTYNEVNPHLVLLDINLPSFNGYHWCQEIRKTSNVPIIFISSRTDSMDQVMAMQMGGDDFIEKPFNMSVTISKIQALLRRTYDFTEARHDLTVGDCRLAADEAKLYREDASVGLTLTELQIVSLLFQRAGKFVSRNALIEKCWESEHFIDDNTLAVNMTRLRKKLSTLGLTDFIETKKNVGYRIEG